MDGDGGIGVEQTAIGTVALAAELNRLASATAEWQTAKAAAVSSLPVPPSRLRGSFGLEEARSQKLTVWLFADCS